MFRSRLAYLLSVVVFIFTSGCAPHINSSRTEELQDTTILVKAKPFTGTITLEYGYLSIPDGWYTSLPLNREVEVSFKPGFGWSYVAVDTIYHPDVTLFNLEVTFETDNALNGGCYWSHWRSSEDDDTVYQSRMNLKRCTTVEDGTIFHLRVKPSYCFHFEEGVLCRKQGLTLYITESTISFSADGSFLPEYREWVSEVLAFYGGDELPSVLQPGYNYTLSYK